ncbi:hypothetical protein [Prochlorococcus sp. MIT 1223]|uniref:hypothetical protein n=1 Tax=Prochlorococcus sp. MIT 1223 TaxID=3096217 RepID=UPI002A761926|nr:hypothetical protein [Prochlorococcus sp. MIT 1223]
MPIDNKKEGFWSVIEDLIESSEIKYKSGDYKGAIDDKLKARKFISDNSNIINLKSKFKSLIRDLNCNNVKYNLIDDYKTKIDETKKLEIIIQLENLSKVKYDSGDYKGAIRAMRRSEKYY